MINYNTPLIKINRPENADDVVKCLIAHGQRISGISAGVPETFDIFHKLLGPGIPEDALRVPFSSSKRQGISTCGLTIEGIHRYMSVQADCLNQDYYPGQIGTSVSRAIKYATSMGAWYSATNQTDFSPLPGPGSYVVIGCRSAGESIGGIEHVLMTTQWFDNNIMESVEGGQTDGGHRNLQCVKTIKRRLILRHNHLWLVDPNTDPVTATGRRIYGWIIPELMKYGTTCQVPEGWESVVV